MRSPKTCGNSSETHAQIQIHALPTKLKKFHMQGRSCVTPHFEINPRHLILQATLHDQRRNSNCGLLFCTANSTVTPHLCIDGAALHLHTILHPHTIYSAHKIKTVNFPRRKGR